MHTLRVVLLAAVVLVVGCGKKRIAPAAEQKLALAGKQASFRDWAKVTPCDVEPKLLQGDLESTSAMLIDYLNQTSAGADGLWSDEQIALLTEGAEKLPPLLDSAEKAIAGSAKCKFDKKDAMAEPLKKAAELVAQSRRRLAEAPDLAATLKAKAALKAWKDKLPEARDSAKKEWCPAKLKAGVLPDIYFAFEDETGHTQWLFCDDSKVSATAGSPLAFEAAAALKKKPKDKPYLDSAGKYPASDIQHAPKAPEKKTAKADDNGEAELKELEKIESGK
jgi:hypothetical protein